MSAAVATAAARFLGATFTLLLTLASVAGIVAGFVMKEADMVVTCVAMATFGVAEILRYDWPVTWGPLLRGGRAS